MIVAEALHYAYPGGGDALAGLSLTVKRGRRLAILGPNGAGKTTLLLHLNGSLRPAQGRVLLDGVEAAYSRTALAAWRRRVGLVLQDADDQLFASSVAEDVSFGPLNLELPPDQVRDRVDAALHAMGISALAEKAPHMLSFGQKKRVAIAGALAMQPEVLLLDEPTAGLDYLGTRQLLEALGALAETTLVFTTHDAGLALAFADEVALFAQGRVIAQGDAQTVLSDANAMKQASLEVPFVARLAARLQGLGLPAQHLRTEEDVLAVLAAHPLAVDQISVSGAV
ncbi:energy-coupling factor ABC transporter ATP-binding protein [Uliginosibacterium gangwonense]|uniref:energy-coupling factor ABC transporter ATP-binding protein n=1 Tax=Uliginosibacterium gangwonense TaxID=392736 RepID=UPI00036C6DAA|nr:ATP-binding cassette domain-containing protein [Uliginosibacterium gangwonense]